eukprot:scaffold1824_cov332-Prasinococcus_capsulatus_cf.AAC.8
MVMLWLMVRRSSEGAKRPRSATHLYELTQPPNERYHMVKLITYPRPLAPADSRAPWQDGWRKGRGAAATWRGDRVAGCIALYVQ